MRTGFPNLFYRGVDLDRARVSDADRSVDVAFSSETPVRRWFGQEVLLHGKDNVDLSRLKGQGAVLLNHDPGTIVGPVRNVRLENKRGRATVVFDDDEDGERALKKVKSGSLKGVSVGYMVDKAQEVREGDEYEGIQGPALIALRWTPYEISLTPIPADPTVGVGRDLTRSLEGVEIIRARPGLDAEGSGIRVSQPELQRLLDLAGTINQEAKIRVIDLITDGKGVAEALQELLRLAGEHDVMSQFETVPPGPAQPNEGRTVYRTVEDVPDDVFARMLTNLTIGFS